MVKPRKSDSSFKTLFFLSLAVIAIIIGANIIQPFSIFPKPEPEPEPDDGTGGDGEGDTTNENRFSLNHFEDNENYTFEFDVKVFRDEGEFMVYIEDYYLNLEKNYVFLQGNIKEQGIGIFLLSVGTNRFTRTHNFSGDYEYQFDISWFDTVNGNNVYHSSNISSFNNTLGNVSNYIQKTVDLIENINGSVDLRGEYTSDNSDFDSLQVLLHNNETIPINDTHVYLIDSSPNNHTVIYEDIEDNGDLTIADGKFMTNSIFFDGKNDFGIINTTVNFTANWSLDTWLLFHADPGKDENLTLFCKDGSISAGFYFDNSKNWYMRLYVINDTGASQELQVPIASIIKNRWYHFAWVIDNASTMRVFQDFSEIGNQAITNYDIADSNSYIRFGCGPSKQTYFDGRIDEYRVLNVSTNVMDYTPVNYFPFHYNDSNWFEYNSISSKLKFKFELNATLLSDNFSTFEINSSYHYNSMVVNLTQEELLVYNFTSDSYDSINVTNHNLTRNDYTASNGTIRCIFNMTGNITDFQVYFDMIIANLYYEANITDLDWSYYSDDTRIIQFQDIETNCTQFIVEFNITATVEDIYETVTYYELSLSEGNFSQDVEYQICFYNYTGSIWSPCNDMLEVIQSNTSNEVLFIINQVPMYSYSDIITSGLDQERVCILFNFSSASSKVYIDYIHKDIYTLDRTDYLLETSFFDVTFFRNYAG